MYKLSTGKMKLSAVFGLLVSLVIGCDILGTRSPEAPNSGNSGFIPPTSTDIVIDNMRNSIRQLNVEDYTACLDETKFNFKPSGDVQAQYASIFANWGAINEKTYFNAMKSDKKSEENPVFELSDIEYETIASDSTVISARYSLEINDISREVSNFSGNLRWVIIRRETGLWYIKSWFDYSAEESDTTESWSRLKAAYSN